MRKRAARLNDSGLLRVDFLSSDLKMVKSQQDDAE
jgi:hypothetical protein